MSSASSSTQHPFVYTQLKRKRSTDFDIPARGAPTPPVGLFALPPQPIYAPPPLPRMERKQPPLPEIDFNRRLTALSNASFGTAGGGSYRLHVFESVGDAALRFAVSRLIMNRTDRTDDENDAEVQLLLSSLNLATWAQEYDLHRNRPVSNLEPLRDLTEDELARMFKAYVGAVDSQFGCEAVVQWIRGIITTPLEPIPSSAIVSSPPHNAMGSPPPGYMNSGYYPPYPPYATPPVPSPPAGAANGKPLKTWTSVLNETCQQRRHVLTFPAENSGPAHSLTWVVRAVVDGIERGQGAGPSKQVAKEDAARIACLQLGVKQPLS